MQSKKYLHGNAAENGAHNSVGNWLCSEQNIWNLEDTQK